MFLKLLFKEIRFITILFKDNTVYPNVFLKAIAHAAGNEGDI